MPGKEGLCEGNHEDLHKLIQSTAGPEGVPLITIDLIERLTYRNATALQFDMYHRKTVDENRNIVTVVVGGTFSRAYHVLIDDLEGVPMDIVLVDEFDIPKGIPSIGKADRADLDEIVLDSIGLLLDTVGLVCQMHLEKRIPVRIGEMVVIEFLQLLAEIVN